MTTFKFIILFLVSATLFITSCSQKENVQPNNSDHEVAAKSANIGNGGGQQLLAVNYIPQYPSSGVNTSPSVGNITINGTTYYAGFIVSKVTNISSNTITIQISKPGNVAFAQSGTVSIKAYTLSGPVVSNVNFSAGATVINVNFNAYFTKGVVHYWAVVLTNPSYPTNYYSSPISINSNDWNTSPPNNTPIGTYIGHLNDVQIYYNNGNLNSPYQCVAFVNNYYQLRFGKNLSGIGNASAYYGQASSYGLIQIPFSGAPRVGDLLCCSGGINGLGHVGIVSEVGANYIKIAHQNAAGCNPILSTLLKSGNTYNVSSISPIGYPLTLQGWLRP